MVLHDAVACKIGGLNARSVEDPTESRDSQGVSQDTILRHFTGVLSASLLP